MCCYLLRGLQSWFYARDNLHEVQELVDSAQSVCTMAEEGSVHCQAGSCEKNTYKRITAFVCLGLGFCVLHVQREF